MKKILFLLLVGLLFSSHDMFLKLDTYFLQPDKLTAINLYNGTAEESENTIDRNRMLDVSIVRNGTREKVDTNQWSEVGNITVLTFKTGAPGTYVAGVSTRPRDFEMTGKKFNDYLAHDGILDVLQDRTDNNKLEDAANERYSKHVKTFFQVGEERTKDWEANLGYPIEFIPMKNPYDLTVGSELPLQLLLDGEPLGNQLVYVQTDQDEHGHTHAEDDHQHGEEEEPHHHDDAKKYRTDANGRVSISIDNPGIHFVRTIHLVETTEDNLTHESNWATVTFEVAGDGHSHAGHSHGAGGHDHGDAGHSHDGEHSHEDGADHDHDEGFSLPAWAWWLGSLVLISGLFFWFNRTKA